MTTPKLTCLCGAISLPLPSLSLPAPTELCHCNPCRRLTGALFAGFAQLSHPPDATALSKCTTYHSSKTHSRLFCSTCGSKIVVNAHHHPDGKDRDDWFAYAGCVEHDDGDGPGREAGSNVMYAETNEWVNDTGDGGLAPSMTRLGGRNVPAYRETQAEPPLEQLELKQLAMSSKSDTRPAPDERLRAQCHCGAISLHIRRADHTDTSVSKLDRFIPFNPGNNNEKIPSKYQARTCTCRSCRLSFGVSLTTYAYIPPPCVLNPHTGQPLAYAHAASTPAGQAANKGLEALKHYWSSPNACRSFCGVCGSTVFYWNENRKDIVNVSAAILRAEEGALARRWVYWQPGMCSCKDEVVDREVLEAYLEAGDIN